MFTSSEIVCVCCGNNARLLYSAYPLDYCLDKKFDIYKCSKCGHGTTEGIDGRDQESLYEGGAYDPQEKFWHKIIRPVLNSFESKKIHYLDKCNGKEKLLLEIGTGKGSFLNSAIQQGYDGYGIEPSSRSFKIAKEKLGERVFQCMLEEMHLNASLNRKFDFIFLWHVLEHLAEPQKTISLLRSFLKPTGVLIFGVPNFDSYQSKFGRRNWYHLDPPRHLSHFTPNSAKIFLKNNSMQVDRIFFNSFFQNMLGEVITLNNILLPHKNILLNFLRANDFYLYKTSRVSRILNLLCFTVLTTALIIPSLGLTLISQLLRKSGTMVVVASKGSLNYEANVS